MKAWCGGRVAFNRSTSVPLDLGRVGQEMNLLAGVGKFVANSLGELLERTLGLLVLGVISVLYSRIATTNISIILRVYLGSKTAARCRF